MRGSLLALALLLGGATPAGASTAGIAWSDAQLDQLRAVVAAASDEGLSNCASGPVSLATATATALELARAHLMGCSPAQARAGWRITGGDEHHDLPGALGEALAHDDLAGFYERLRPRHPDYAALRLALRSEADPARRATLLRNMERWRWMPLELGERYLLVNAPRFEAALWENGTPIGTWRVIVGRASTPTPVFSATVTGVTYNPWWNVPASIVRESVGALVRNRPAEARRRGFVWGNGVYRQRPGPNNALGLMKLVMPNPFNVYLHDTNAKALFERPVRMFSHGCIRVDNALGLAATLLGRDRLADTQRQTVSFSTPHPVPVYVAYFTASAGASGAIEYHEDIYGRDARMDDAGG